MITPGWMPNYRTRGPRKVMSYVRVRKRAKKSRPATAPSLSATDLELIALTAGSAELPAARVRTRKITTAAVAANLLSWLGERARWLRPRALPAVIALIGLCGIIASTSYLAHPPSDASAATRASRALPKAWIPARVDTRWQHVALAAPGASTHASGTTIDW